MTSARLGWTLVPNIPTERMLSEFAGRAWSGIPRPKQDLEREAYAEMLAVAPSPPESAPDEPLHQRIRELERENKRLKNRLNHYRNQVQKFNRGLKDESQS